MTIKKTALEGVYIIEPQVFSDARGTFCETFSERDFERLTGWSGRFVQDNQSTSRQGVVRGLHFQRPPHAQAKLVRVAGGRILDVAVDMRLGSPDFGRHIAVELSADNNMQLFIPQGFAHGFSVLSESATVAYKVSDYYHPELTGGVLWNDPTLGIDWQIDPAQVVVSQIDSNLPELKNAYGF